MKRPVTQFLFCILLTGLFARMAVGQDMQSHAESRGPDSLYSVRASDVIGASVINGQNEEIGDVDDIVIVQANDSLLAIISVGGFLGLGEKLVAIEFDQIKVGSSDERVFLNATKESLLGRPAFIYNEGEPIGRRRWEKRLSLKQQLEKERAEVREARQEVVEEKRDVEEVERKLEKLKND